MKTTFRALLTLCVLFVTLSLSAIADTTLGTPIGRLPYTIKKPGKYRLLKNLTIADNPAVFAAITVNVPGVVIDLNGFTLSGPRNIDNQMIGVTSGADRLTVKNGTIFGFSRGVTMGTHANLEDVSFIEPTQKGFSTGNFSIARRCNVTIGFEATGTTAFVYGGSVGESSEIDSCSVRMQGASGRTMFGIGIGPRTVARNCTAVGTFPDGAFTSRGIYKDYGAEPSRVEGCTVFGFSYAFDGFAMNYDRCHASDFSVTAKNGGTSVTGNNF